MFTISSEFPAEYSITINVKKTVYVKFGYDVTGNEHVIFDNSLILWPDQVKHFIHVVHHKVTKIDDYASK